MAEKKEKRYVSDDARLMAEWNWEKNSELGLMPQKLTCGSGKRAWWKCSQGHEWQAAIVSKKFGRGCPYCAGKKVLKGYNDFLSVYPNLAQDWNYEKNGDLRPENVSAHSGKLVWWKCDKGHEWKVTIHSRKGEHGCPYCSGKIAIAGENDLQTVNPELAKQWNYEKNGGLTPRELLPNSNKKVWWKCNEGHEWKALVSHRNKGVGCPYCSGKISIVGENDLQTVNPELAKEWNYEKNIGIAPTNVVMNSNKKVWWKCNKGHEWQTAIRDRNKGTGCPICQAERHTSFPEYIIEYYIKKSGIDVIHSYKSKGYELDIFIPSKAIAIEYDGYYWHKDKTDEDLAKNQKCNRDGIKLYRVREGLFPLNDSSIDYVVQKNQKNLSEILGELLSVIIGTSVDIDLERDAFEIESLREYTEKENSLLVSNPQIAKEWNYEKNGTLKPENFLSNSRKKVWWKCNKGHEWQAIIADRNNGNGCPYCSGNKILVGYNDLQTLCPKLAKQWHPNNSD